MWREHERTKRTWKTAIHLNTHNSAHRGVLCSAFAKANKRTSNIKYHHVYGWFNVSRVVVIKFSNLSKWNGAHNLLIQTILGLAGCFFLLIFSFCIGASLNLQFQLNEWNYLLWSFFLCRRFLKFNYFHSNTFSAEVKFACHQFYDRIYDGLSI